MIDADTYAKRWLIAITVMLVTVLEVLDMTIVNVSMPHMMGSLGADSDQISWVLTSYIVSAGICMPLTGFLVVRYGRKRLLLLNIIGFLITSILCGMSLNLTQIVFFRILQGIFGASLSPLSQIILRDTFPPEEQGKAMAIWGIGIMVGPVLGPTLGGYITEALNWRWVFYINIPPCIIAWIMTIKLVKESPTHKEYIDWVGAILMILGVGFLQLFLDRGNIEDWFESKSIISFAIISALCLITFIVRGWSKPDNIIKLQLFKDRNFASGTLMMLLFAVAMFGNIAINPLMLEQLMHYPTDTAGWAMAPRGIASAIGMVFVAKLINKYDARIFIFLSIVFSIYGTYLMTRYDLTMPMIDFVIAVAIQGFGMGLFFVPLSTISFNTLSKSSIPEAAGLFSFGRSIGSSIGISIIVTYLTRNTQQNWNHLTKNINLFSQQLHAWLSQHQLSLSDPFTLSHLTGNLANQASMIGYINAYALTAALYLVLIPCIFLLRKPATMTGPTDFGH